MQKMALCRPSKRLKVTNITRTIDGYILYIRMKHDTGAIADDENWVSF
jgi:hypothetical protein